MTWATEPVTVAEEFVSTTLLASADLVAALGGENVWPAQAPPDVSGVHIVHDFAGPDGGGGAVALGRGIVQYCLRWDLTAWIPGMDRQPLRAVMAAVQDELTGPERAGRLFRFVSVDGSGWDLGVRDGGPIDRKIEVTPSGLWQRVSARYLIEMRQIVGAA